ncbi:hypothetical protein BN1221_04443c [Brenneria goodwinii]|uniref:Uncharacterized protein n=1 Tax=Brenneria goodwinii TaxID=1109412 RepID=A0A0G4K175_9GAMM|nr:hypothetical protein BN1221_04443c [Brenneria goodwinii]
MVGEPAQKTASAVFCVLKSGGLEREKPAPPKDYTQQFSQLSNSVAGYVSGPGFHRSCRFSLVPATSQ